MPEREQIISFLLQACDRKEAMIADLQRKNADLSKQLADLQKPAEVN